MCPDTMMTDARSVMSRIQDSMREMYSRREGSTGAELTEMVSIEIIRVEVVPQFLVPSVSAGQFALPIFPQLHIGGWNQQVHRIVQA